MLFTDYVYNVAIFKLKMKFEIKIWSNILTLIHREFSVVIIIIFFLIMINLMSDGDFNDLAYLL